MAFSSRRLLWTLPIVAPGRSLFRLSSVALFSSAPVAASGHAPALSPAAVVDTSGATSPSKSSPARARPVAPWVHFVSGGVGGGLAAFLTFPLDLVKTRMQAVSKAQLTAALSGTVTNRTWGPETFRALGYIYGKEGLTGLWRGIMPTLVGILPSRAIYFSAYAMFKKELTKYGGEENSLVHMLAAVAAGATVSTATNPIWVVKTRMQLQTAVPGAAAAYTSSWDCIVKTFKAERFRGFYKGLAASYVGTSETAIQWVLYERLKASLQKQHPEYRQGRAHWADVELMKHEYFLAASLAKFCATTLTYPHEVIRTRLREQPDGPNRVYRGVLQGLGHIARSEGLRGLYGGISAHMFRVVPNAAIMLVTVEAMTRHLQPYS